MVLQSIMDKKADKGKRVEKYGRKVTGLRHSVLRWPDCLGYEKYFGGKNLTKDQSVLEGLDAEWMKLILEALEMGIGKEEIREFLNKEDSI